MEIIRDRLLTFIEHLRISSRQFELDCDLTNGYVAALNNARSDKLESIHARYPELNMNWLLFGEGSMLTGGSFENHAEHNSAPVMQGGVGNTQTCIPAEALERTQNHLSEALAQNTQLISIISNLTAH